jgi:hypothetical protein
MLGGKSGGHVKVSRSGSDGAVSSMTMPIGMGAPAGGFFDAFPIHLVTNASLRKLAEHSISRQLDPARFRPNITIETVHCLPFCENDWIGSTLTIGEHVELAVVFPTPRCAVPALAHGAVGPDLKLPHAIERLNKIAVPMLGERGCLGAYAEAQTSGVIHKGDEVRLRKQAHSGPRSG